MWVSNAVSEWFHISRQAYEDLKAENAALRAELSLLKVQAERDRINFDWMKTRTNALEMENKALLQKAYDISLPVPQLARQLPHPDPLEHFSFDDIGDELAKRLRLNQFENQND